MVFIAIVLIGILCIIGVRVGTNYSNYDINISADENIDVKTYIDYEKDYLIVYLTNNNTYNIGSFEVEAIYYDESGNRISDDSTTSLYFISGGDYVFTLDLPHDSEYNNYIPNKIDLSVKVDKEFQQVAGSDILYNDKVATSYKDVGNKIEVSLTNNSGKNLNTVEVAVLFMKNNKPIYVEEINGKLDIGDSYSENIEIPIDWDKSENEDVLIEYDSIKVVVNRATHDEY